LFFTVDFSSFTISIDVIGRLKHEYLYDFRFNSQFIGFPCMKARMRTPHEEEEETKIPIFRREASTSCASDP
jgi:hypothetical protein